MTGASRHSPSDQAAALGAALKAVRERQGMSQQEAADGIGASRQAWQNYEAGRPVILRTDLQERLAEALGVSLDELLGERDRIMGVRTLRPSGQVVSFNPDRRPYEVEVYGRAKAGARAQLVYDLDEPETTVDLGWAFNPTGSCLRVAGDSMTGYVESGQLVFYDRTQWPRRGDGCVIETQSGEVYVKEYVRSDGGVVTVRQLFPEETLSFPLAELKGVYKIRMRGD